MKFFQKNGWIVLVILIVSQAFYKHPPAEYTIRLAPYGVNQLFKSIAASNGIPGEERVQLMQIIQEQIIQQDKEFAHFDSLTNHLRARPDSTINLKKK